MKLRSQGPSRGQGSRRATVVTRVLRGVALAGTALAAASCHDLDTTRVAAAKATLGDDIFGVFCDRIGASSFTEDLSGQSFQSICHYDDKGQYGSKVDTSALPPPQGAAATEARRLSIAKVERMAQRRSDLIRAINATFPDVKLADVTKGGGAQVRLHDALFDFAQKLTPLYESNPFNKNEKKGGGLLPDSTRALSRLFNSFGLPGACGQGGKSCEFSSACGTGDSCDEVSRTALSRISGRRGYRPFQVGLGAVRPALGYPGLRDMTKAAMAVLGPGGTASPELQQVLTVLKQEMATAAPVVSALPKLTIDAGTDQPNRPRSDIEFAAKLFLTQDDTFNSGAPSRFIALRDGRGVAVPAGSSPGVKGTIKAPFVDMDGDGYADIDAFGRFVDGTGTALSLDPPFAIPEITQGDSDSYGRPNSSSASYAYLDTSKTLLGALSGHLVPLVDGTQVAAAGDPDAWKQEHETLMYALAGAYTLYGDREPATYDYSTEGIKGKSVSYSRFNPDTSPLPDLIHAAGQVLGDEDSDAILLSLMDLVKNHEQVVARLLGAALKIKDIADQHDALAAKGSEPLASLDYKVTIWDEMAVVLDRLTQKKAFTDSSKGLLQTLLQALAKDVVVSQQGGANHMGDAMAKFAKYKDQLTYDHHGLHYDGSKSAGGVNGPAVNITVDPNGGSTADPQTPMGFNAPHTGANRSCLQRSLALIHNADGGPACNRDGATVPAKVAGLTVTWPVAPFSDPYKPCELFKFNSLANFYLDSLLPATHPKRSALTIQAAGLNDILSFLGSVGANVDDLLQQSSDITGLTQHPESAALNRLVFYGATSANYPGMPDFDAVNQGTQVDKFVSSTLDPVSAMWCPKDANGLPHCSDNSGTERVIDANTIFLWERFGFTTYLSPVVQALASTSCTSDLSTCNLDDTSGEQIFDDLVAVLNRHWPGTDHGSECQSTDSTQGNYCALSGVNKYEPILADAFETDIVPALNEFAKVVTELSTITVQRGPNKGQTWTGADVLEKVTTILFSTKYAQDHNLADRKGSSQTTWTDGKTTTRVTGFTLFADALHGLDARWDSACAAGDTACQADVASRKGQWKRARSQLVDELMSVDGSGTTAAFHNKSMAPMLVTLMGTLREQINANCPDRETSKQCTWATKDLSKKFSDMMGRPLFAALSDLQEKLRNDEPSRRKLEAFLTYALSADTDNGQALQGLLASLSDIMQVLADDANMAPIMQAMSVGMDPANDAEGDGAADTSLSLLKALTSEDYDRYHLLDQVLPNLVTPIDDGSNLSPIEIFMDVIADVNRIDASQQGPMKGDDYQGVMSTMKGFMGDKTRGLEQLYTIIQNRPKQ